MKLVQAWVHPYKPWCLSVVGVFLRSKTAEYDVQQCSQLLVYVQQVCGGTFETEKRKDPLS